MKRKESISLGGNTTTTIFVIFLILKLTNVINWSWWWVTSPLWIWAILAIIILTTVYIISRR